jgi:hypothetical protein
MVSIVSFQPSTREFSIEEPPAGQGEPELSLEALKQRVRQQEMLADCGVLALNGTPFPELLDLAARLVAEGLNAEFAKVLKFMPGENRFLVCAGVGRDRAVPCLRRQSRGVLKTIPRAPGMRRCSEHEPLHGTRRVRARAHHHAR